MSEHHAKILWQKQTDDFSYTTYNRDHIWQFNDGLTVAASAAPAYLGTINRVDPEEALVAALSSCHMLTFLAICAKKRIVVESYEDAAVGFMEKNENGKLAITRAELNPVIQFAGEAPDAATMEKLHHLSHEECFIANSVKTEITVNS